LFVPGPVGRYGFLDTRNNCFSNRRLTGILNVHSQVLVNGSIVYVVVGAAAGLGLAAAGAIFLRRRSKSKSVALADGENVAGSRGSGSKAWSFLPFGRRGSPPQGIDVAAPVAVAAVAAAPSAPKRNRPGQTVAAAPAAVGSVVALYNHVPSESGELASRKGDTITVLQRDASGWWTGKTADGKQGIFPSNYVQGG